MKLIGIDTGGTFTDFVLVDGDHLRVHKVLSTPQAPEQAILQGVKDMGLDPAELRVVHGSTVATNAVLEGKGARTLYIGNRGFGDLLTIGRQARQSLYDLQPEPVAPPVPAELCLETGGRLGADGKVVTELSAEDLACLAGQLADLAPESVAINLLFSYLDESLEQAIADIVPDGVFVSRSSVVLPEIKEYERGMATWLNALVGPLMGGYLGGLASGLPGARVAVMQSSGETIAADLAGAQSVRLLLSGPAGGLRGARYVGLASGRERLLSFDMGGTSTDVALLDGDPHLTSEGRIGRYPVAVPMVDMHTIGAGGGSIARLDAGGMLQVGPESAGAAPGPACYGAGGQEPTVTDANLVLGRLRSEAFLGGRMPLDEAAARASLEPLAGAMGCGVEDAALGVLQVANENMAQALRVISVQRGIDPRQFTLVSFGGAGGLHVCALADALGLSHAMVPVHAGVLSALGMLATAPGRRLSRTLLGPLASLPETRVTDLLKGLARRGRQMLLEEGIEPDGIQEAFDLDLRYRGQSYTLTLPWQGRAATEIAFHRRHRERYGHDLAVPVELVNLRASLTGPGFEVALAMLPERADALAESRVTVYGVDSGVPVYARDRLAAGQQIVGPALVTETVATTWLAPGWACQVDVNGNLLLEFH